MSALFGWNSNEHLARPKQASPFGARDQSFYHCVVSQEHSSGCRILLTQSSSFFRAKSPHHSVSGMHQSDHRSSSSKKNNTSETRIRQSANFSADPTRHSQRDGDTIAAVRRMNNALDVFLPIN